MACCWFGGTNHRVSSHWQTVCNAGDILKKRGLPENQWAVLLYCSDIKTEESSLDAYTHCNTHDCVMCHEQTCMSFVVCDSK